MHSLDAVLPSKRSCPTWYIHGLFADLVVGVLLPLGDDHGLEILALVHLRLDLCDQLGQIRCILEMC
jgi:hypothetical protein